MFSSKAALTETGVTLLLRAEDGEDIAITKFQIGSGSWDDGKSDSVRRALKHIEIEVGIADADYTVGTGFVQISGVFYGQQAEEDFIWTELGVIAEDEDGEEYLYAYVSEAGRADIIKAGGAAVIENRFAATMPIGESGNVTVTVADSPVYAGKEEFETHEADASAHGLTPGDVGAAASGHAHEAGDITGGVLPMSRGGTGVATQAALTALLLGQADAAKIGLFRGDGTRGRKIVLGFRPDIVAVRRAWTEKYHGQGAENNLIIVATKDAPYNLRVSTTDGMIGYSSVIITDNGFMVSWFHRDINAAGMDYIFIAAQARF